MSNPFADPPESGESERLWYREIPEAKSSVARKVPKRFEPPEWSAGGNDSSDWNRPDQDTQGTTAPRVQLRTPSRPLSERLACSSCNWLSVAIAIAVLAALASAGGFAIWSYEQHHHSISQMSLLQSAVHTLQGDLDIANSKVFKIQSDLDKLQSLVINATSTSNIGIYNNMLKLKKDLLQDMNKTTTTVHNEVLKSENTMHKLVAATSDDLQIMRRNVSNMVTEMTTTLNKTVTKINRIVDVAKAAIDIEVRNVSAQQAKYREDTARQFAAENDFVKYQLAGTFTLLSCLISLWDITSHIRNYNKPRIQRRVCAILWMVPIYSVTSWLSLVFPASSGFLGALRDCYEAYAVYTFVGFLIAIMSDDGGIRGAIAVLAEDEEREEAEEEARSEFVRSDRSGSDSMMINETAPLRLSMGDSSGRRGGNSYSSLVDMDHEEQPIASERSRLLSEMVSERASKDQARNKRLRPPFSCCGEKNRTPWQMASTVIYQCQVMAMQFVLIKPLLALMPVLFYFLDKPYDTIPMITETNHINWKSPVFYTYAVENLSVMIAFYGLLSFYYATEKHISMYNPWPKFLCIKGVVFVTFWQSIAIETMSTFGMTSEEEADQIQNFLICIEMLLASIAHYYIFPYEEWEENYQDRFDHKRSKRNGLGFHDSLAFGDFATDMKRLVTKQDWAATPTGSEVSNVPGNDIAPAVSSSSKDNNQAKRKSKSRGRGALDTSAEAVPAPPSSGFRGYELTPPPPTRSALGAVDDNEVLTPNSYGDIFGSVVKAKRQSPQDTADSFAFLVAREDDDEEEEDVLSLHEAQV